MPGARRMADIAPEALAALSRGEIASRTLVESLAINFDTLIAHSFPDVAERMGPIDPATGILRRMEFTAQRLLAALGPAEAYDRCLPHPSDTVRGFACYAVRHWPGLSFEGRLQRIRPLADDAHMGVREWAWLALRPHVATELGQAIALLTPWTEEASPNLRRFASEITRPRGVWCAHITALKDDPASALVILDPLAADPAKYVQDSVANWVNDASKTRPEWAQATCERWLALHDSPHTAKIVRRALRTLRKARSTARS